MAWEVRGRAGVKYKNAGPAPQPPEGSHLNTDLHTPVLSSRPSCLSLQLTHPDLAKGKRLHVEIEVVLLIPVHMTSTSVSVLDKTLELKVLTGQTVSLGGQTWLLFLLFL